MHNWQADFEERVKHVSTHQEHIELCAWLIHRFLWIHPFFDYNGRMSRLLGELYFLQHDLPAISFRSIPRVDFVTAMTHATATGDLSLLIRLMDGQKE